MTLLPGGPVLALDSSTGTGSAAVGDAEGVRAEMVLGVGPGHSSALLPAVEEVMRAAGVRPGDLSAIVVGGGPGSFTGLRIAAATAKGMVQALRIPLFAYSGLLAAAAAGWGAPGPVCALFDARRRDVYAGCYRFGAGGEAAVNTILEPTVLPLEEVIQHFRGGESPLFVGDGALQHRAELEAELGATVMPGHLGLPRAAALLWLAHQAPRLGHVPDAAAWEPEYIRASGAERIAAAGAADAARPRD